MPSFNTTYPILEYKQLASTNNKAKELLKEKDIKEGTVVKAIYQSAGRGYASNKWESEKGKNVTASWILKPVFLPPQHQFRLTQMLSMAVKDTVDHFLGQDLSASIKWPNDIYVNNNKIAGILVENSIMGDTIKTAICGIGLNVNQTTFVSDAPNPVSLSRLTGMQYSVDTIIEVLSAKINHWYDILRAGKTDLLLNTYHDALFRKGVPSTFAAGEELFEGIITGTDAWGRLIIENNQGTSRVFDFKEVAFVL